MGNQPSGSDATSEGNATIQSTEILVRIKELDAIRGKGLLSLKDHERIQVLTKELDRIQYLLDRQKKDALDTSEKEELDALRSRQPTEVSEQQPLQPTVIIHERMEAKILGAMPSLSGVITARLRPVDDKEKKGEGRLQYDFGF
jgi:hypothetical protein